MQEPDPKSVPEPAPAPPRAVRWALALGVVFLLFLGSLFLASEINRAWMELDARDCQWHLTTIDRAKEHVGLIGNREPLPPTLEEIVNPTRLGYLKTFPTCPSGHSYTIREFGVDPTCGSGLPGHDLRSSPPKLTFLHRLLIVIREF